MPYLLSMQDLWAMLHLHIGCIFVGYAQFVGYTIFAIYAEFVDPAPIIKCTFVGYAQFVGYTPFWLCPFIGCVSFVWLNTIRWQCLHD